MIEKEEVDRSLISPELIELEAEIAQIKDFPDSPSRLAELIDNLNLPVAHHLTKRRRG